jgi:hypothetical protein
LRHRGVDQAGIRYNSSENVMAQATSKNQDKIIATIGTVVANQKKILKNQDLLKPILTNQDTIIRNQQAILKNQKKILADHARHFRELARRK